MLGLISASKGVVIGTRKGVLDFAISLSQAAAFVSEGLPERPNRIVRYNTVQEQATTNWYAGTATAELRLVTGFSGIDGAPYISTRFTHWNTLANGGEHFYTLSYDAGLHHFKDSEFHNTEFLSVRPTQTFSNVLFNRCGVTIADDAESISPSFRNCTMRGGTYAIYRFNSGTWTFQNNLFDEVTNITQEAVLSHGFNAYTTNSVRLTNTAANDIKLTVSNITYRVGTLGRFYLPTNLPTHNPLLNTTSTVTSYSGGSTNANLLGLYNFTSITNNVKETNTVVDIGYHYVATEANGMPIDSDFDGFQDYFEDSNGNGLIDSGESDGTNATDLGLRVVITRPKSGRNIP